MPKQTNNLGDISLPVGEYEGQGNQKQTRFRNVGSLMETVNEDGSRRRWIRLNADVLHASLFALSRPFMEKGADSVIANVFEKREQAAKTSTETPHEDPVF